MLNPKSGHPNAGTLVSACMQTGLARDLWQPNGLHNMSPAVFFWGQDRQSHEDGRPIFGPGNQTRPLPPRTLLLQNILNIGILSFIDRYWVQLCVGPRDIVYSAFFLAFPVS